MHHDQYVNTGFKEETRVEHGFYHAAQTSNYRISTRAVSRIRTSGPGVQAMPAMLAKQQQGRPSRKPLRDYWYWIYNGFGFSFSRSFGVMSGSPFLVSL